MIQALKKWYRQRPAHGGWRHDLSRPGARFAAHLDMNLVDHGVLRRFWSNRALLDEGVWRSNQPSPRVIRKLARQGFRTIVNFRGESRFGSYILERDACARHGIRLVDYRLYSRGLPSVADIFAVKRIFETAERPMLIHCKSGADRAGIAAALYVLAVKGGTVEEAQRQLSFRFLHVRHAKTGILDRFLDAYAEFNARQPTAFLDWVQNHYDPVALRAGFRPRGPAGLLVDGILRRE